jgi:hypothetical protein
MTLIEHAGLPGQGQTYLPAGRGMRVELRPIRNPAIVYQLTLADNVLSTTQATIQVVNPFQLQPNMFINVPGGERMRVKPEYVPGQVTVPVIRGANSTPTNHYVKGYVLPDGTTVETTTVFDVLTGDVNDSGANYATNRAEAYARNASPSGTHPDLWPDPPGSTRWYGFAIYVPSDYVGAGGNKDKWLHLIQWKSQYGGSPWYGFGIADDADNWAFEGTHYGVTDDKNYGAVAKGSWTYWQVGFKWSEKPTSDTANTGWFEAWRNETQVRAQTPRQTMMKQSGSDPRPGLADPQYLKQGIYRGGAWDTTMVVHFGPMKIGTSRASVGPSV